MHPRVVMMSTMCFLVGVYPHFRNYVFSF